MVESPQTKKGWTLVPEEELTEEQVRTGFNNLRRLHFFNTQHIHGLKEQRKKLNIEKQELMHENATLRKEIKLLHEEINKLKKDPPKKDFKKSFLDSL